MECGRDVRISTDVRFVNLDDLVIGNHVAIDSGFYCTTKLTIGDYVHISPHVAVIGGRKAQLSIGSFCFVSVGANIVCASEQFYGDGLIGPFIPDEYRDVVINKPVTMENFSGICASSVLLPGVTMHEGSVLGANSMLKEDAEPWTIYAGSPAKPIRKRFRAKMIKYARELGYEL